MKRHLTVTVRELQERCMAEGPEGRRGPAGFDAGKRENSDREVS